MDTPSSTSKKTSFSISLKSSSLTPCRRLGLSRPSPGSLRKSYNVVVNTPEQNKLDEKEDTCHDYSLRTPQNQQQKFKRSLTTITPINNSCDPNAGFQSLPSENFVGLNNDTSYVVKKRKLNLKSDKSSKELLEDKKSIVSSQIGTDITNVNQGESSITEVTPELIQRIVKSINEKRKKLELLKVQEIYGKKHKVDDVRGQTARWREGGREALRYSLQLARDAGVQITLQQLMAQHGFPPHLMGYNEEYDDFTDDAII